jgi:hypothetical protein
MGVNHVESSVLYNVGCNNMDNRFKRQHTRREQPEAAVHDQLESMLGMDRNDSTIRIRWYQCASPYASPRAPG